MITMKLPFSVPDKDALRFKLLVANMRREQSIVIRSAYKRYNDGMNEKEIRAYLKTLITPGTKDNPQHGWSFIDSWFEQSGVCKGIALAKTHDSDDKAVLFGTRKSWFDYIKGRKSKDEFKQSRLLPLISIGESPRDGNRKFKLNIKFGLKGRGFKTGSIVFQPFLSCKIDLRLPYIKQNYYRQMVMLQRVADIKEVPYQIEISDGHIHISCDESIFRVPEAQEPKVHRVTRWLTEDDNPKCKGWVVIEGNATSFKRIECGVLDISELCKFIPGLKSADPRKKKKRDKLSYELYHISRRLVRLALHFGCVGICWEDLRITTKEHGKGTIYNRLVNNTWQRRDMMNNLRKRCVIARLSWLEVDPRMSSFIGNIVYDDIPDPICAAIELARRCLVEQGSLYPEYGRCMDKVKAYCNRWKGKKVATLMNPEQLLSWEELYAMAKKCKLSYHFSWKDRGKSFQSSRFSSHQSKVTCLVPVELGRSPAVHYNL